MHAFQIVRSLLQNPQSPAPNIVAANQSGGIASCLPIQ